MDVREKLIELIAKAKYICANDYSDHTEDEYIADTLLDSGVTVQKLDGCDFCKKFDFAGARAEVNKYGAHISLVICNTKLHDEEQFKFCPMCGRRLPQPPKGE